MLAPSLGIACSFTSSVTVCHRLAAVNNIECFTFGSPKVGNRRFASFLDAQLPKVFRHVNDEDAVVSLPPAWAGFQHAGMVSGGPCTRAP